MGYDLTARDVYRWFWGIARERARTYRPNVIHVSEVVGCLRRAWYERKYGLVEAEPRHIVFAIGNGVHEALQDYLGRRGWQCEVEVAADISGFKLVGHVDLYHPEENVAIELKTTSRLPERPYFSHLLQLNSYLYMVKARLGYVVYIQKRDGLVSVHRHRWDPQLWRQVVERAKTLHKSIVEGRLPRPEPGPLCNYCGYKWRCFASRSKRR